MGCALMYISIYTCVSSWMGSFIIYTLYTHCTSRIYMHACMHSIVHVCYIPFLSMNISWCVLCTELQQKSIHYCRPLSDSTMFCNTYKNYHTCICILYTLIMLSYKVQVTHCKVHIIMWRLVGCWALWVSSTNLGGYHRCFELLGSESLPLDCGMVDQF